MAHEPERKRKRGALEDISNKLKAPPSRIVTRNNLKVQLTQSQAPVSDTQSSSSSQENTSIKKNKLGQEVKITRTTSRRTSTSEEIEHRERQRLFDIRMSALSSEFDLDVYLQQVEMIDSKENDHLAREVDMFHRKHEDKYRLAKDFLAEEKDGIKSDINCRMRGILVDWLVEVGEEYKLVPHTLHMAIQLVDRSLSILRMARGKLQLLGCVCMMLACKYEEVVGPSVDDFIYISDNTYKSEDMIEMESVVLEALEYKMSGTNVYHFLERFILAGCTTETQKHFAHYLAELAVIDYQITITYSPSILAASIIYMTRLITEEKNLWTPTLHYYTKYNAVHVSECALDLHKIHNAEYQVYLADPEKTRAVTDKYMSKSHSSVSKLPPVKP